MATVQDSPPTRDYKRIATWSARALTYFLYAWTVINEIILILGFTLLLFGANPDAGFTQWAYRNLDRVMEPFRGIFPPVPVGSGTGDVQPVVDTAILFAMLIYAIIALSLRSLIDWLSYRLAKIDAQHEQEEQEAKVAAAAELRAQQTASMNAATAPAPTNPAEPAPMPTTGQDPLAR